MSRRAPETGSYSNAFRALGITFSNILTTDRAMHDALTRAKAAAEGDVTVLLLGETGTGKNLVAQAIHNASRRAGGPLVALNCSALPDTLLESELFGHERGSFTSADRTRRGAFERADHGTLFLDEIGDMSPAAQAKVLHAVEYKQFARVGGEKLLESDVRFVAATNQPLPDRAREGGFRSDLYYRLAEVTVRLPPLRERKGDIPLYVDAFLEEAAEKTGKRVRKLSRSAHALLREHDWPGNVRELRAALRSAVMLCQGSVLDARDLGVEVRTLPAADRTAPAPGGVSGAGPRGTSTGSAGEGPFGPEDGGAFEMDLASVERVHVDRVLRLCNWKKKDAAKRLGVSRPTLDRKISLYGLAKPD